jgi:translation initiation factor 2 beta subunit (eIF-2beta)/eIF-5
VKIKMFSQFKKRNDGSLVFNYKEMNEEEYQNGVNNNYGLCLNCGEIREEFTEGDAEEYECSECGQYRCMGFQMALPAGYIEIAE